MNFNLLHAGFLLASLFGYAPQDSSTVEPIVAAELGQTINVHRSGPLWFTGQFTLADVALFEGQGIRRVISARQDGELSWDEKAELAKVGVEYVSVPFRQPDSLTDEVFDRVRALLGDVSSPTLFHCGSANRVGGAWLPFRVLDQGVPLEQALAEAQMIGLSSAGYKDKAIAYIERERMKGVGQEESIKEGINDSFKDAELNVDDYLKRFEVESREVYSEREEVVKLLGLKPGMTVADIGAGTGFYSFLFSEVVAGKGWVYAVDIAPRFLEHIRKVSRDRSVTNVSPVLCAENSVVLPPESIDLAFACDTYHHFEYPTATMKSILRALKPGGRFVIVDFERIPGTSREWMLNHVRAGKEVFQAEIVAAGFEFVREVKVKGFEENYFLEFVKPKK
ncbi:MAG: hypothetical protein ACI8TQ_001830 [Planctomycetota bacterium]|jgi:uncharacterized protein (TIGR01244 family)